MAPGVYPMGYERVGDAWGKNTMAREKRYEGGRLDSEQVMVIIWPRSESEEGRLIRILVCVWEARSRWSWSHTRATSFNVTVS